jgi:multidrug efflux pump subunit AcrB
MWLIEVALKRPYTFIVMAVVIVLGGVLSIRRSAIDIFPAIDIPVVSVIWAYRGMPPEDMERRIVNGFERSLSTVDNIEHVESQTLTGVAVVKLFLHQGSNVDRAIAQVTAVAQQSIKAMPAGTVSPTVVQYSATNLPIMQVVLDSATLTEQQLFDYGANFIRPQLVTVPGAQVPFPYGGRSRSIMIDIDPARLHAFGLSPVDVESALGLQNVVLPGGSAKLGSNEYPVMVRSTAESLDELGSLPVKTIDGHTVYLRDVANVRDGSPPQTNIVHVEGNRSMMLTILKNGDASTLEVVARVRDAVPRALARLPKDVRDKLRVRLMFDQSVFVRASVDGVVREALIGAALTGVMIMLFLGSLRSMLTVIVSIPLSMLSAVTMLWLLGQTINMMMLSGLALAVGILVDDATVEVENIHRNLHQGKPLRRAILDGAQQIAVPALVSTLCICIVFVPIAFLTGAARSLFLPMALAVVLSMLTSYLLSRTLVPTMVCYLLRHDVVRGRERAFAVVFERLRIAFGRHLAWALWHRGFVIAAFAAFAVGAVALIPLVGRDFFPPVDAGLIKLHVRNAPGTRIEETEIKVDMIEHAIRDAIPAGDIETMVDVLGTPYSGLNLSLSEGALISGADAEISISLAPGHAPTQRHMRTLRERLNRAYPDTTFFFLAPDISNQALNFGLAAPIDVEVVGPVGGEDATLALAESLAARIAKIPGAVDVHLAQVPKMPYLAVDIDRTEAQQANISGRDVATDLAVSLASSALVAPSYWVDKRGVQYQVEVQTPQYVLDSIDALRAIPIAASGKIQTVGNVAQIRRTTGPANITHRNVSRTYDVHANVDADLGSVSDAVNDVLRGARSTAPTGTTLTLRGQAESMNDSFAGLFAGLIAAIGLVYLLLVVNFQSWRDPLVILMALPGALAGIVWTLFVTGINLSVPALIGSIMSVGVATANSILIVAFANEQRARRDAHDAALAAGMTRFRPVVMTALAMMLGMIPLACGLGEGGEQGVPLGCAVIGGLACATVTTLFLVPVIYSLLRARTARRTTQGGDDD